MEEQRHQPVLVDRVIELLRPLPGESFIDMTAGFGGHAIELLRRVGNNGAGYLIDRDDEAIKALEKRFATTGNVQISHGNYADSEVIGRLPQVDMILLDLGVSSVQLDVAERGFSFNKESKLDMRMDRRQEMSAFEIVNQTPVDELADIIYQYGEERNSRRIARAIEQARRVGPIVTTTQLAEIIAKKTPRRGKIHPATRTFAAIRIKLNEELDNLDKILPQLTQLCQPGGRIAIISFHSLEDRRVKQFFRAISSDKLNQFGQIEQAASFKLVTKRAILGKNEDRNNPRARSAKLRVVEYIK